jgi:hypothetical protein
MSRRFLTVALAAASLSLGACSSGTTAPADSSATLAPALASLQPSGGALAVDPTKPVILTFTMPMMTGMEMLVVVNEGTVTGAQVAGTSVWSADRKTMTFTPNVALKAKTTYVVHLSPSLQGTNGKMINMSGVSTMGGQVVSSGMMGSAASGMMNGQWGPGMMGAGWKASDGTFGMIFTFVTA